MRGITLALAIILCVSVTLGDYTWKEEFPSSTAFPPERYHHGFAVINDTIGVLVAGFDFNIPQLWLSDTWVYYFDNQTWQQVVNSTDDLSRAYFTADAYEGQVILFGGAGNKGELGDVWRLSYTNAAWSWSQDNYITSDTIRAVLPRQFHSAAIIADKLWVFGGHSRVFGRTTNEFFSYDLNTLEWTWIQQDGYQFGPSGRQGHTVFPFDDPILGASLVVFGGYSDKPWTSGYNDTWQYIINQKAWIQLYNDTAPPIARYGHNGAIVDNSTLIIYGGMSTYNITTPHPYDVYYSDVWALQLYGGGASEWVNILQDTSQAPGRRQGHQTVAVNNTMYSVGGYVQFVGLSNDIWYLQQNDA